MRHLTDPRLFFSIAAAVAATAPLIVALIVIKFGG